MWARVLSEIRVIHVLGGGRGDDSQIPSQMRRIHIYSKHGQGFSPGSGKSTVGAGGEAALTRASPGGPPPHLTPAQCPITFSVIFNTLACCLGC